MILSWCNAVPAGSHLRRLRSPAVALAMASALTSPAATGVRLTRQLRRNSSTAPGLPIPETLPLSVADINTRQLGLRLQDRLLQGGKEVISTGEFMQEAGGVGLTRPQAEILLEDLMESGAVHHEGEAVHLFPTKVCNEVNRKLGLPLADPCPDITARIEALVAEFAELDLAKSRADEEVAKRRLTFWSVVAVGSGLQMAGFSFLTFPALSGDLCLEWDVVEPVSFFVTQAYIVMWFAYFFLTRREHTLLSFDERRLYTMSRDAYRRRKVNVARWAEVRDEISELRAKKALYTARAL